MLFSIGRHEFNYPRYFEPNFYHDAANRFVDKFSLHRDVMSIFLFGQVSVPGISDLDFMVVMKDPLTEVLDRRYSIMKFNRSLRYIYNETQPFLVTEKIFKEFWKIFPTHNLRCLYGEEFAQSVPPISDQKRYNMLVLIEICHNFYPTLFLSQLYSDRMNVRYSLLILNSLKFPLQLFMDLCGQKYEVWMQFINQVADLRKNWFEMKTDDHIYSLKRMLHEASSVSMDLIEKLDRHIEQRFWTIKSDSSNGSKPGCTMGRKHFIPIYKKNEVLKSILNEFRQTAKWKTYLPITFFYPLTVYSRENGVVSQHIANAVANSKDQFLIKDYNAIACMKDRIRLLNQHAAFYLDNDVKINMVHGYYGFTSKVNSKKLSISLKKAYRYLKKNFDIWR